MIRREESNMKYRKIAALALCAALGGFASAGAEENGPARSPQYASGVRLEGGNVYANNAAAKNVQASTASIGYVYANRVTAEAVTGLPTVDLDQADPGDAVSVGTLRQVLAQICQCPCSRDTGRDERKPLLPVQSWAGADLKDGLDWKEAEAMALARVPGTDGRNIHMGRDHFHGHPTYSGKIYLNDDRWSFEIDAVTGKFLQWDKEKA